MAVGPYSPVRMPEKEWAPSDVFDVFGDGLARQILVLASDHPVSAEKLAEQLDVSKPTIYRRVNALIDYDLVRERQQIDTEGNHYQEYETTLKRVVFEIEGGGYNIDLELRQRLAHQFESFWTDLEASGRSQSAERADQAETGNGGSSVDHG